MRIRYRCLDDLTGKLKQSKKLYLFIVYLEVFIAKASAE